MLRSPIYRCKKIFDNVDEARKQRIRDVRATVSLDDWFIPAGEYWFRDEERCYGKEKGNLICVTFDEPWDVFETAHNIVTGSWDEMSLNITEDQMDRMAGGESAYDVLSKEQQEDLWDLLEYLAAYDNCGDRVTFADWGEAPDGDEVPDDIW